AGKGREGGDDRGAVGRRLLVQQAERVGVLQGAGRGTGTARPRKPAVLQLHLAAHGLEAQERPGAQEAVAAQALAADDALEEEGPFAFLDLAESADRGQRVADELSVHRHQTAVSGQLQEFVEAGMVAGHDLRVISQTGGGRKSREPRPESAGASPGPWLS